MVGLVQDCSNAIVLALDSLQSCIKPAVVIPVEEFQS